MNETKSLMERLQKHDWYYEYSDDHRVWKRGRNDTKKLRALLADLRCPYEMDTLRRAVFGVVFEDYEEEDGFWYRTPRMHKNIAGIRREELMHRADQVQILAWIETQDEKLARA